MESGSGLSSATTAIQWLEKHPVGIAEIDAQHEKLFKMFNALTRTVAETPADSAGINEAMYDLLYEITDVHFTDEEKMMWDNDYPDLLKHKEKHESFRREVSTFLGPKAKAITTAEILERLQHWLVDHLQTDDRAYADYFAKAK